MKQYIVLGILLVNYFCILGQNTMSSKKDIDPKAKSMLEKLKKQYDSYRSLEIKFEMDWEIPGHNTENQKGTVVQDGTKYFIKMTDQEIYSDGKSVWVYLKKQKEVQLTDANSEDDSAVMSPKQMLRLYENGNYGYAITEERKVGKQQFVDIEFKPLDKKSEYTKMRLTIDKIANKMVSLRVFLKDGSKYTLKVSELIANKKYDPSLFAFNPKTVPGVHLEDLRID